MAQTREGAIKVAAQRLNITVAEYMARIASGEKHCMACRVWHSVSEFAVDRSRSDGMDPRCRASRATGNPRGWRARNPVNPKTGRPGPEPQAPRDGDRKQARQRVNVEVRTGRRPHPNSLPCTDCGHEWSAGERRHEYDHYLGYSSDHHYDVQPVCTTCHAVRDSASKAKTHCTLGHEFTPENTVIAKNGTRHCKSCRRLHDLGRGRGAEYWRAYRDSRRQKSGANNTDETED